MIFLLIGKNSFFLKKRAREIKERYIKEGFSPFYFNFGKEGLDEFKRRISKESLFQKGKIFSIENFPFSENIFSLMGKDEKDVFILEKEAEEPKELPRFLSKYKIKIEKFPLLSEKELEKWVKKEFSKNNIFIGKDEISFLLGNLDQDLWGLYNEILKISAFKRFQGKVQKEEIEGLVDFPMKINIFGVIDKILSRNKKEAASSLENFFLEGESPYMIFSLLAKYLSLLLISKEARERMIKYQVFCQKIKEHPFVLRKTYYFSGFYSLSEIKKIYQKVFYLESLLKEGRILPQLASSLLVLNN